MRASAAAALCVALAVVAGVHAHAPAAGQANPGLRVTVAQTGLDKIVSIALPLLNKALGGTISLPDQSLDEHVPVVGHVTVDLTSIQISGFQLPGLAIKAGAPDTITGTVTGVGLHVSLDYKWRKVHWPHISDHGSVDITASGGNIDLGMSLTSVSGRPHLNVLSDSCDLSSFDVKVHGKVSWLYNLILGLLKGTLKKDIDTAVAKELSTVVDKEVNAALGKMALHSTIGGGLSKADVDYSLAAVNGSSTYLSIEDELSVINNHTGAACAIQPPALPVLNPGDPSNMLHIMLGDSFLDCVAWVSFANDAVHVKLGHDTMPGLLNTSAWAGIVPGLAAKYPNAAMNAYVGLYTAPALHSSTSGVAGVAGIKLNFTVIDPGTSAEHPSHVIAMNMDLGIDVSIADVNGTATMMLNVTDLALNMTALQSTFGPVNVGELNTLFHTILPLVKDLVNSMLAKGFPLPGGVSGVALVNPTVKFEAGYLAISADFAYKPPNATELGSAQPVASPIVVVAPAKPSLRGAAP